MGIVPPTYDFCDGCGKKIEIAGRCLICGRHLCFECAKSVEGKIYCEEHVPAPPPRQGDCFIATAAYGSPLVHELDVLRAFRDRRMLTSKTGKLMVSAYYTISPPIASIIAQRQILKKIIRNCIDSIVNYLEGRGF